MECAEVKKKKKKITKSMDNSLISFRCVFVWLFFGFFLDDISTLDEYLMSNPVYS